MPKRSSASPNVKVAGPHTHATNFLARELIYDSINGRTSLRSQTELENRPKGRQKNKCGYAHSPDESEISRGLPRREVRTSGVSPFSPPSSLVKVVVEVGHPILGSKSRIAFLRPSIPILSKENKGTYIRRIDSGFDRPSSASDA